LWNLHDIDSPPTILSGHEKCIQSVAFSPDSQFLASGSDDWTIRVWTVKAQQLADKISKKVWRNLNMQEWGEFVSRDLPYQRTCLKLPSGKDAPPDAPAANLGEPQVESTKQPSSEVFVEDFSPKFRQLLPEQQKILDFIARRAFQGQDSAEQDVTTLLERPAGDVKTYLQLETLRLLGFLSITNPGIGPGTIRYSLSRSSQEFLRDISSS
jgi:WD40 repeat protein